MLCVHHRSPVMTINDPMLKLRPSIRPTQPSDLAPPKKGKNSVLRQVPFFSRLIQTKPIYGKCKGQMTFWNHWFLGVLNDYNILHLYTNLFGWTFDII